MMTKFDDVPTHEVPNTNQLQLVPISEIATLLRVSLSTANRWASAGAFGRPRYYGRSKRYKMLEVTAYIENGSHRYVGAEAAD